MRGSRIVFSAILILALASAACSFGTSIGGGSNKTGGTATSASPTDTPAAAATDTPEAAATQTPTAQSGEGQATPTENPAAVKSSFTNGADGHSVSGKLVGTAVIYLAGRTDIKFPPAKDDNTYPISQCNGNLPDTLPVQISVHGGDQLTFTATGKMDFYGNEPQTPPDGYTDGKSDIANLEGISGYAGPRGALVGVFLSDENPKGKQPPDTIDYSTVNPTDAKFEPQLLQVFFIGDGLTGTGSGKAQVFVVPQGATRLYLGFADAAGFAGPPGCYNDNIGSFDVTVKGSQGLSVGK